MGIELLEEFRAEIMEIARRHGVANIRVFGSVARGEAGPDSDVDLLVSISGQTSPWFPGGLVADLEDLLGRSVQVVTEQGLHDLLREQVMSEAVPL
ncbi:nucleotidyltransferase family protein [Gemmatimonadota bacterium]